MEHVRQGQKAVYNSFEPRVSDDQGCVTFSFSAILRDMLTVHPPLPTTTDVKVLWGGDNARCPHNTSKGSGGQTNFGARLWSLHGHDNRHKPNTVNLLALWEGGDKYERMKVELAR